MVQKVYRRKYTSEKINNRKIHYKFSHKKTTKEKKCEVSEYNKNKTITSDNYMYHKKHNIMLKM